MGQSGENQTKLQECLVFVQNKGIKHSAAGVVVSCKIPILATRVRFPGGATVFLPVVRNLVKFRDLDCCLKHMHMFDMQEIVIFRVYSILKGS